jgi:hypothetical protein
MPVGESAMRMKEAGMRAAFFFSNGNDRRQTDFISMSSVISPAPIASVRLTKKTLPLGVSRCRTSAFFSHFTLTRQRIRGTSCPLSCHGWGTANVDGSITDLIHDLTAPASPVALRCDLTWLSPLWRFAPRHPDAFRLGKPIRSLTLREMRSTGGGANRLGLAQADLRSVSGCRSRAKESECELRCGRPC